MQHAGETAAAPLVVKRALVGAALFDGCVPRAASCGVAPSSAAGRTRLGIITIAQMRVFLLFCTLCLATTAACLPFLCVFDMLRRAVLLTVVSVVAGSVLGET